MNEYRISTFISVQISIFHKSNYLEKKFTKHLCKSADSMKMKREQLNSLPDEHMLSEIIHKAGKTILRVKYVETKGW